MSSTTRITKEDVELLRPLIRRYERVVAFNRDPGAWNKQWEYGGPFAYQNYRLTDRELAGAMLQRFWIAAQAPANGRTDVIRFDIDCGDEAEIASRDDRYRRLRSLLGEHRVPLVYQTPSGRGLRVCYRIPSTPLTRLVTGQRTGLVADVLRGAGLEVARGQIEIFPQVTQCDRLPLGRNMALLDPESLEPLPDGAIGNEFSLDALDLSLSRIEQWHAAPLGDFVAYVSKLPRMEIVPTIAVRSIDGDSELRAGELPSTQALIEHGLVGFGSRQRAEWAVGSAFVAEPSRYAEFGLGPQPSNAEVASAIATWLSMRHNGFSNDWDAELARSNNDVSRTIEHFAAQYLRRNRSGKHFIDRLSARAVTDDLSMRYAVALSEAEWDSVFSIAERHFPAGAARYRFEVWYVEYLRRIKGLILRDRREGRDRARRVLVDGFPDEPFAVVELQARWMEEWPFGGGETEGKVNYLRFLDVLREETLLWKYRPYRAPKAPGLRGRATEWLVKVPDLTVRARDLDLDLGIVRSLIEGLTGYGGTPMTQSEALHAIHVSSRDFRLSERYGRRTASRLKAVARTLIERIELRESVA